MYELNWVIKRKAKSSGNWVTNEKFKAKTFEEALEKCKENKYYPNVKLELPSFKTKKPREPSKPLEPEKTFEEVFYYTDTIHSKDCVIGLYESAKKDGYKGSMEDMFRSDDFSMINHCDDYYSTTTYTEMNFKIRTGVLLNYPYYEDNLAEYRKKMTLYRGKLVEHLEKLENYTALKKHNDTEKKKLEVYNKQVELERVEKERKRLYEELKKEFECQQ